MKYKGIRKINEGHFITRFDVDYETEDGQSKVYEMISRKKDITSLEELRGDKPDAVVLILTNMSGDRILVNREFRMASGSWVMNFPAGLIDEGEDAETAAARELREETGLILKEIDDIIGLSYSAVGFSNEMNVCVVGKCDGTIRYSGGSLRCAHGFHNHKCVSYISLSLLLKKYKAEPLNGSLP